MLVKIECEFDLNFVLLFPGGAVRGMREMFPRRRIPLGKSSVRGRQQNLRKMLGNIPERVPTPPARL